ncbi:hypothetical protein E2C01_026104 [Portunus trituberculatus]|uniref:Uncharacterized protein n=1 Tax=Portunus trituberculatus TaxID=210409 RepID=A0A5B7EHX7_PORTR|nr:hypothetical protein [Portunus trituberculatus]
MVPFPSTVCFQFFFLLQPKDDMMLEPESALLVLEGQTVPPPAYSQPARRGRKPRILRSSRGNTHSCTTTARKILPRPSPMQVPLTLSHLQPPPPPLSLPLTPRSKPPQAQVMVRPTLQPPSATNSGRKILPWPHQLSPANLAPVSQKQKLQPLNPSLTTCPPAAQTLPLSHLQPINSGTNSGLMPLQPLSLTQLRSPPPSSCISQLGVPLSPQKMPVPPKGSRKTVTTLPQLAAGPPTTCTRVPLLPLSEASVKKSSPSPSMHATTASHVRKLLPRPLKAAMRPAASAVFQQHQQQSALPALQQLHPVPPVSTQQTVSLQQFENPNPSTSQTTSLALQTLNVSGQPPSLSGSSQVVSVQHVRAMAMLPPQPSQKVQLSEPSLQSPHHLHTVASSTSPQRLAFQQVQQGPAITVSQAVAIHSLPAQAPSTPQKQATTLCQVHTLQSSAGHTQSSRGTSFQALSTLAPESHKAVSVPHYSSHSPGDTQAVPQVSPVGKRSPLSHMCSTSFCPSQSTAPTQTELQNSELTFHDLSSANQIFKESSTLCPDTNHSAKGQDVMGLHIASRQGMSVGTTPNGTVLKVPIQPLKPSASFPRGKRKYLRRNPRELKANKKKSMPILKMASVSTYSWPFNVHEKDLYTPTSTAAMQGRKILPRPCPASLAGSQLEQVHPVTTHNASGWLVPQVEQHEGCSTVATSLDSSSVARLTHAVTSSSESQLIALGLSHKAQPVGSSDVLAATDQGDTSKSNITENFLQPVSPAKVVAACTYVPHDEEITAIPEKTSCCTSQGVESSGNSGTKIGDGSDKSDLECTDCAEQLLDLDNKSAWNQAEEHTVTPKDDVCDSGDDTLDHTISQVNSENINHQLMSQNSSSDGLQDQSILQDTIENKNLSQVSSQETLGSSIQAQATLHDNLKDGFQDQHTLQSLLEDSTETQSTLKNTSRNGTQDQSISQCIQEDGSHSQPIPYDTQENTCSPISQNNPVDPVLDHPSSQDTERNNFADQSTSWQSSTPSELVPPLIIPASQGKENLREENDGLLSQDSVFEDKTLPICDSSLPSSITAQDENVCSTFSLSPSCPQSRLPATKSSTSPEATTVLTTQEQNTQCHINGSPSTSCLCQNSRWKPPSSLPNTNAGSLSTSNSSTTTPPCTFISSTICQRSPPSPESSLKPLVPHRTHEEVKEEVLHTTEHVSSPIDARTILSSCTSLTEMMTRPNEFIPPAALMPKDNADCSPSKTQEPIATDTSTFDPAGHLREDFRVITATTTTVTITTTTTAVSTTTTTSQYATTHTYIEAEVKQESSNPPSQEEMDPSLTLVSASCHSSQPKCPPTCMLMEQETCPTQCQTPPKSQRNTSGRHQQQQHRTMRGPRLKALVRAQRRTIQMLRNKLQREQKRSKALWKALRCSMAAKVSSEGRVFPKGIEEVKREEGEGITQPKPSPPVTRSRSRPKQVVTATLSSTRLKRKNEDTHSDTLKKVVTLNHSDDYRLGENSPHVQAICIPTPSAGKTELQTLVREFVLRDDVSRTTRHGTRHFLHYLPLLHKRFMAYCCQPCSLETFQQHLPPQMAQRIGEELEICVCLICQNPELKVESLVRRRLLPLNTHLEEVAFSSEDTFKEFLASVQALKARSSSQLMYSEWFIGMAGGSRVPQPQKKTLTRPLREVVTQLEGELDLLRLHLKRASHQYEATLRAKCEAEQSPQHAVLQAEWSPLIILHALGADGAPALQQVVSLQCGYLWSHADSLGFIAVSGCRDQRAAAVCASLEPLLARLIQQGVRCLTLLVDPKTDLSAVLEYTRRSDLEVRWVFSEPGHGAGVAEAVGNSVTQLICDTVNSWGSETVLSAKDVFSLISPNSSNLVYYYSEEDVWRSSQLLHGTAGSTKTANKLIKPKTILSL